MYQEHLHDIVIKQQVDANFKSTNLVLNYIKINMQ